MEAEIKQGRLSRDKIRVLVLKDIKLKYNSAALGFLWSLLVVFTSGVCGFVLGIVVRFGTANVRRYTCAVKNDYGHIVADGLTAEVLGVPSYLVSD